MAQRLASLLTANRRELSLVDCVSFEIMRRRDICQGVCPRRRFREARLQRRALIAFMRSSSSSDFGQSPLSKRDSPRSASSLPPVWQVGQ